MLFNDRISMLPLIAEGQAVKFIHEYVAKSTTLQETRSVPEQQDLYYTNAAKSGEI